MVVKLKRASTIRNPTNSWSKATVQCAKVFLSNGRGVAFYAVPHAGSTKFAEYVKMLLRCNDRHHPGIMDNIQPWQRDMEELSVDFDDIVNWKQNQYICGNNFYKVEDADHMEVVQAPKAPSNVPCELEALAQSMAEECQGLQLAQKVIGTAMFGKTSKEAKEITHGSGSYLGLAVTRIRASRWLGLEINGD
ncbi:unnamed protein product [Sphagnum troendelagicum]